MTVIYANEDYKMKPVPEVGKEYHFWDDGKCSPGRHYICRCERVIHTLKEAKKIVFDLIDWDKTKDKENPVYCKKTLYEIWKDSVKQHYWLIAEDTDAFVEISCPRYDENNLWAVRTVYGGWFTLDIQSSWQGGDVDVTGEKYSRIVEEAYDDGNIDFAEEYKNETYN